MKARYILKRLTHLFFFSVFLCVRISLLLLCCFASCLVFDGLNWHISNESCCQKVEIPFTFLDPSTYLQLLNYLHILDDGFLSCAPFHPPFFPHLLSPFNSSLFFFFFFFLWIIAEIDFVQFLAFSVFLRLLKNFTNCSLEDGK